MFLVLIDAHSKWIEVFCTSAATSAVVIEELRSVFARFGLPETIVTDNGTSFISAEFEKFLRGNGIKHITSAPYHPATNGLAERAVQIVKRGLKKVKQGTLQSRIAQVLFAYRITPQGTTGVSPSELLLGRRPRSRLELLKPNLTAHVEDKQQQQKASHDTSAKMRVFQVGDLVYVKNHRQGPTWLCGKVIETTGPLSYRVQLEDERIWRCHQDHLRQRVNNSSESTQIPNTLIGAASPPEAEIDSPATPTVTENETSPPEVQTVDLEQSTTIEKASYSYSRGPALELLTHKAQ